MFFIMTQVKSPMTHLWLLNQCLGTTDLGDYLKSNMTKFWITNNILLLCGAKQTYRLKCVKKQNKKNMPNKKETNKTSKPWLL